MKGVCSDGSESGHLYLRGIKRKESIFRMVCMKKAIFNERTTDRRQNLNEHENVRAPKVTNIINLNYMSSNEKSNILNV